MNKAFENFVGGADVECIIESVKLIRQNRIIWIAVILVAIVLGLIFSNKDKVYSNSNFGISFSYSPKLTVIEQDYLAIKAISIVNSNGVGMQIAWEQSDLDPERWLIDEYHVCGPECPNQQILDIRYTKTHLEINGVNFIRFTIKNEEKSYPYEILVGKVNNNVYKITIESKQDLVEKMVPTIKFN